MAEEVEEEGVAPAADAPADETAALTDEPAPAYETADPAVEAAPANEEPRARVVDIAELKAILEAERGRSPSVMSSGRFSRLSVVRTRGRKARRGEGRASGHDSGLTAYPGNGRDLL